MSMVRRVYDDCGIDVFRSYGWNGYDEKYIEYLASVFRVSILSATIRVRQLRLDVETYRAGNPILYSLGGRPQSRTRLYNRL